MRTLLSNSRVFFLIREFRTAGGLNISASHNHPGDNGGKLYNLHCLNEMAEEQGCDLAFTTDPDAGRLGVIVANGDFVFLHGNEIGMVFAEV